MVRLVFLSSLSFIVSYLPFLAPQYGILCRKVSILRWGNQKIVKKVPKGATFKNSHLVHPTHSITGCGWSHIYKSMLFMKKICTATHTIKLGLPWSTKLGFHNCTFHKILSTDVSAFYLQYPVFFFPRKTIFIKYYILFSCLCNPQMLKICHFCTFFGPCKSKYEKRCPKLPHLCT